jgi:hypothetical protein
VPSVVIKNVPVKMNPEMAQVFEMLGFQVLEESSGQVTPHGPQLVTDNKQRKSPQGL